MSDLRQSVLCRPGLGILVCHLIDSVCSWQIGCDRDHVAIVRGIRTLAWGCTTAVDGDAAGLRWTFLQPLTVTELTLKIAQNEQKSRKSKKAESCAIGLLANGFSWILCRMPKRRFLFSTACGGFRPINGFIMGVSTFLSRRR